MLDKLKTVMSLVRRPWRGWMAASVVGSVIIAGLDMLGVAAMLPLMQVVTGADRKTGALGFISSAIGSTEPQMLLIATASVVALAFIVKSAFSIVFRWWLLGHATALEAEAATELMRRYVMAPYATHRERKLAEVHRNISGAIPQTFSQVVLGILSLAADALTLVAIGVVLFAVSPWATLLAVVLFLAMGWGTQAGLKHRYGVIGETMAQSDLDAWAALMPGINGFRESRLAAAGSVFVSRFARAKADRARASRELSLVSELPKYVLEIGLVVAIAAVAVLLFATGTPDQALSVIGVFAAGSTRILPTINRLVATSGVIRAGQVGLRILSDEVQSLDQHRDYEEYPSAVRSYRGDIELDGVEFSFVDSTEPVLRSVNVTIEEGQTTAFVGSSGAGKSTLLDVILGLLEPTAGTVRCGGREIRADLAGWYAGLGVVPQDVFLLDDSLESNIAFAEDPRSIDRARLNRALSMSQLDELVAGLPEGLSTRLGERGVRMSGGQRQRIGIARALYREPGVLVLDEATSALDNVTEHRLTETIDALSGSMTIIIVAHRLSTVRHADKIVYMANGSVESEGTFDALVEASPGFSQLVALGRLV
ncbi:ABC transporter ATP-binding protein [Sinomonas sp. P10A9]|uniref:ABC transporter ATP-binding protein n=1 Tax=Sinomonas puerhi TaxID=3238584 RepID=A0AB39L0F0_9MICC